jgi:hypothetical protein
MAPRCHAPGRAGTRNEQPMFIQKPNYADANISIRTMDNLMLPDVTKDPLNAIPNFTY